MQNFIWTKHVLQRTKDRKIPQEFITKTLENPDKVTTAEDKTELKKNFGAQTVTVVVKKNEKEENIVLSCWIDPPNTGTQDFKKQKMHKEMRKASGIKKFWLTVLSQLGF